MKTLKYSMKGYTNTYEYILGHLVCLSNKSKSFQHHNSLDIYTHANNNTFTLSLENSILQIEFNLHTNILKTPNNYRQNMQTLLMYIPCKGEYIKMALSAIHI